MDNARRYGLVIPRSDSALAPDQELPLIGAAIGAAETDLHPTVAAAIISAVPPSCA